MEIVDNESTRVVSKLANEIVGQQKASEIKTLWDGGQNDEARQKYGEWIDSEQTKFVSKVDERAKELVESDIFLGSKDAQDYVYQFAQKTVIGTVRESKQSTDFAFSKVQELTSQNIVPTKENAARFVATAQILVDSSNIPSVSQEEAEFINSCLSGKPDDGKAMSVSESGKLGGALVEVAMAREYLKNEAKKAGVGTDKLDKFASLEGSSLNGKLNTIPDWRMDLRSFRVQASNERHLGSLVLEPITTSG